MTWDTSVQFLQPRLQQSQPSKMRSTGRSRRPHHAGRRRIKITASNFFQAVACDEGPVCFCDRVAFEHQSRDKLAERAAAASNANTRSSSIIPPQQGFETRAKGCCPPILQISPSPGRPVPAAASLKPHCLPPSVQSPPPVAQIEPTAPVPHH